MGQQLIKSDCVVIMGLGGSCTIVQDVTGAGARAASPNNGLWEMCGENVLTLLQFVLNWGLFWTGMFVGCFPFCYANNTVFTSKCFPPTFLQLILNALFRLYILQTLHLQITTISNADSSPNVCNAPFIAIAYAYITYAIMPEIRFSFKTNSNKQSIKETYRRYTYFISGIALQNPDYK